MMLLTHLTIEKAVEVIRHKRDESASLDWLLQCAHDGEIELLALVREPVYFVERVDVPVNWTEVFGQTMGVKTKSRAGPAGNLGLSEGTTSQGVARSNSDFPDVQRIGQLLFGEPQQPSNGSSRRESALEAAMPIAPPRQGLDTPDAPAMTLWSTDCARECLAIADYVSLEPVWVGRIFASRDIPRTALITEMFFKGKKRSIFTKSQPGGWRVREDDLYMKASELDRFLKISNKSTAELETDLVKKNNELSVLLKRIKEDPDAPAPLTKQQMLLIRWPINVNLEKILSDPPIWVQDARTFHNSPGSGSSLWDPAIFAYCLATTSSAKRPQVRKEVLDTLIRNHLKTWISAWEDLENFI